MGTLLEGERPRVGGVHTFHRETEAWGRTEP